MVLLTFGFIVKLKKTMFIHANKFINWTKLHCQDMSARSNMRLNRSIKNLSYTNVLHGAYKGRILVYIYIYIYQPLLHFQKYKLA